MLMVMVLYSAASASAPTLIVVIALLATMTAVLEGQLLDTSIIGRLFGFKTPLFAFGVHSHHMNWQGLCLARPGASD